MRTADARRRASEHPEWNVFVALAEDGGDERFCVAVKDVIDVAGVPTTSGTSALPASTPEQDAPVVAAVRAHGGGIVGKTNLHEWAIGLTSINPSFGTVANPRHPGLIAGGSSGGSAAAVAAGLCDWALGTDTGGSIRVPAVACGVVGLKPTYGLLSNDGVVQVSESLDTVGPLGATVRVVADALAVLAGPEVEVDETEPVFVRVPDAWLGELDPGVAAMWQAHTADLAVADLPDRLAIVDAAWVVLAFEAHRFHLQRLRDTPGVFSPDVRAVLDAGRELTEAAYERARDDLAVAAAACDAALGHNRVLVAPATAASVPAVTSTATREALTRFTRPFNGTGQPTLCLPVHSARPPAAVQLVAPRGRDHWLVRAALVAEAAWSTPDHRSEERDELRARA